MNLDFLANLTNFAHANPVLAFTLMLLLVFSRKPLRYLGFVVTQLVLLPLNLVVFGLNKLVTKANDKMDNV